MTRSLLETIHPETGAGGFAWNDQRIVFYTRVRAVLPDGATVLDFGAGRGKWDEVETGHKRRVTDLRDDAGIIVGADVSADITANASVDHRVRLSEDGRLPFADAAFDGVVSWAVFEHVQDESLAASELSRVVKPGGWICAWTPARFGYVGLGAQLVPNRFHAGVLSRLGMAGARGEADIFDTAYRMNTRRRLRTLFPYPEHEHFSYYFNGPPAYHGGRRWLAEAWRLWAWLSPAPMSQSLHVFIRKSDRTRDAD